MNKKNWVKKAAASIGTAVKVMTAVVLGAVMLLGTYAIINGLVVPETNAKVESLYETPYTTAELAGVGGVEAGTSYNMLSAMPSVGQGAYGVFRSDADLSDFDHVEVDGIPVASGNYTTQSGSTIVRLLPEYTGTLNKGDHTISIVSTDGSASADFEVVDAIEFSIRDCGTFYATPGMTWADWIASYGISAGDNGICWIGYVGLGGSGTGAEQGVIYADIGNGPGWNDVYDPDTHQNAMYYDEIKACEYSCGGPQ